MKNTLSILSVLLAAVLLLALAACGVGGSGRTTTAAPPQTTQGFKNPEESAPATPAAYEYEIRMAVDDAAAFEGGKILFKFSRPFFEETSALAKTANGAYAREEAAFREKMRDTIDDTAEIMYGDWNYTELSGASYEADGVASFTTTGDWYMGGVHNSWITGHTFDFNRGRELKIGDVLQGDAAQITDALAALFWAREGEADRNADNEEEVRGQSGPDANFYLAADGVHVFYEPYVIPATQNGVDILIPWTSERIRPLQ